MASASCSDPGESTFFPHFPPRRPCCLWWFYSRIRYLFTWNHFLLLLLLGLILTFKVNSLPIARTRNGDVGRFAVKGRVFFFQINLSRYWNYLLPLLIYGSLEPFFLHAPLCCRRCTRPLAMAICLPLSRSGRDARFGIGNMLMGLPLAPSSP